MVVLVTGPVRSGKSRLAVRMAQQFGGDVCYVATAALDAGDPEWAARIRRHRADRPASWTVLETADRPAEVLTNLLRSSTPEKTFILDSLGTWLAAHIPPINDGAQVPVLEEALQHRVDELLDALVQAPATVIAVSEETGWGIVPAYPAGRLFRDVLGRFNQVLAQRAQRAYLVICGHAFDLKAGVAVEAWSR
jgi:adenosylcobinamide kinase/adenosylcobinamide-phosphate guanylyltransferase